jgi:hypothetical protein
VTVTRDGLRAVLDATTAFGLVHCCARDVPFTMLKDVGARAVGFDVGQLRRGDEDGLAELAGAGAGLFAGALKTDPERDGSASPRETAERVIQLWHRMGMPPGRLAEQVVITPACGLADLSPAGARAALARCREAARLVPELIDEGAH